MATVSEICFYETGFGVCPQCHRERPLGKVNCPDEWSQKERCIDCHFGPPMEYWEYCSKCGSLEVNPEAYCYQCEQNKKKNK